MTEPKVINIVCEAKVKVSNTQTGTIYNSEEEAQADIADPGTETQEHHIRRDVTIIVPPIEMGLKSESES